MKTLTSLKTNTMKEYLRRAAGMLAGVKMLRCAMMLALLVVTATETRAKQMYLTCFKCGFSNNYSETNSISDDLDYQWINRATCTREGVIEFFCSSCRWHNRINIPALGHDWGNSGGNYCPLLSAPPALRSVATA